jgi:ABC-type transporter Mla subunit MlaD
MSIIDELQSKLSESHNQIETVVAELKDFAEIKKTITSSDEGLRSLIKSISGLSDKLSNTANSFEKVISSMGQAADLIKETDPAKLLKEQEKLEVNISQIDSKIDESKQKIIEQVKLSVSDSQKGIIDTAKELATKQKSLTYLVVLNLLVSGFIIFLVASN